MKKVVIKHFFVDEYMTKQTNAGWNPSDAVNNILIQKEDFILAQNLILAVDLKMLPDGFSRPS